MVLNTHICFMVFHTEMGREEGSERGRGRGERERESREQGEGEERR